MFENLNFSNLEKKEDSLVEEIKWKFFREQEMLKKHPESKLAKIFELATKMAAVKELKRKGQELPEKLFE